MGRRPNPQRREELLDEILEYVQRNGLASLSLRPLASALGTSTYTLTYQFGSKKELLESILTEMSRRERRAPHNERPMPLADRVDTVWDFVQTDEGKAFQRLRLEGVTAVALEGGSATPPPLVADLIGIGSAIDLSDDALAADREGDGHTDSDCDLIASDDRAIDAQIDPVIEATLVWATIEGLILDFLATGDFERVGAAVGSLTDQLRLDDKRPAKREADELRDRG